MPATYEFGVTGTLTTAYGLMQNFNCTNSGQTDELKDAIGNTIKVTNYDEILEAEAELVWDTTQAAPGFGDVITTTGHADAGKFQVISNNEAQDNVGHKKLKVSLKRWVTNSLPA